MNRCGYDYVTLGNHDFNYGMDYLDSYLNALHARCVCENVRWDGARVRFLPVSTRWRTACGSASWASSPTT